MREIIFRGKDRTGIMNHLWQEGSLDNTNEEFPKIVRLDRWGNKMLIDVAPETVGQFTGLTDKNGKRIFEGDILKVQTRVYVEEDNPVFGKMKAWNFGEIKEWLVEKETEKTYIIRRPDDRPFSNGKYRTNTIRKADMRIYDLIFFHSHEAALTKYKQMLASRIATAKNNIKGLEARIVEYEECLRKLEEDA